MRFKNLLSENKYARVTLVVLLLFGVLYFFGAHEGIYYADDLSYSLYASKIAAGTFDFASHQGHTFIHRPAVYIPTAFLYFIFGTNVYTYTIWPLICTLAAVFILYKYSPTDTEDEKALSLVLLGLNFFYLYFSNIFYPDNIVTFFGFAGALLCYWTRTREHNSIASGAGVALLLFIAFLAKETAVFYLPFLIGLAISDSIKGDIKLKPFWLAAVLSGLVLGVFYLVYYYQTTGHPLQRFIEINEANYVYDNYVTKPDKPYLRRLLWSPIEVMISTGTFIPLVFMLGGTKALSLSKLKIKNFWMWLFLSSLAVLWFVSTSYTAYSPLSLDARMFNLLLPPLVIAASIGIEAKLKNRNYTVAYGIVFTCAALYLHNQTAIPYILLAIYFFWCSSYQSGKTKVPVKVTLAVLALILLIRPMYFMVKPKVLYYDEHQDVVAYLKVHAPNEGTVLYAPAYFTKAASYYGNFNGNRLIQTVHYSPVKLIDNRAVKYLLINDKINSQTPFTESIDNEAVLELFPEKKLVYQSGPLFLYKVDGAGIVN